MCFRRRFPGVDDEAQLGAMNAALVNDLAESGYGLVSSTRLHGRYAIRLCVLNHTSGLRDVLDVLSWLEAHDVTVPPAGAIGEETLSSPILDARVKTIRWVDGRNQSPKTDPAVLSELAVFRGVDEAILQFLAGTCHEKRIALGEHVVHRWDTNRDFYVIISWAPSRCSCDTRVVGTLGPDDFFGELAAQDWGGGFGYPRLADVIATAPLRLLVVPHQVFPAVAALPGLRDRIPGAVRVRLPES